MMLKRIENIPRDKLMHFSSCVVLGLLIKLAATAAGLGDRPLVVALVFLGVAAAQLIDEYLIQPTQPGRTARDWRDALAGIAGGGVAAMLVA